jgi:hypothetical protein
MGLLPSSLSLSGCEEKVVRMCVASGRGISLFVVVVATLFLFLITRSCWLRLWWLALCSCGVQGIRFGRLAGLSLQAPVPPSLYSLLSIRVSH